MDGTRHNSYVGGLELVFCGCIYPNAPLPLDEDLGPIVGLLVIRIGPTWPVREA